MIGYHTTDCNGITELAPTPVRMRQILDAVVHDQSNADYPDAWITDGKSGWTLTYINNGVITLENADRDDMPTRCIRGVSVAQAFMMWQLLSRGQIDQVLKQKWEELK